MKQIMIFVIFGLLVLTRGWASGDEEEAEDSGGLKLTGWSYEVDTVNDNLRIFTEQTGIAAEPYFNFPSNQYHDKQITSFVAGTDFDVVYVRGSYLAEWASAGWIIPLDDFEGIDAIKKDIAQGAVEQMSFQGKLYGLPYYAGRSVMVYNSEHLERAGFTAPPATWDELAEQARVIKNQGISEYPIMLELNKSEHIMTQIEIFTHGHGGRLFDENNDPVFDGSDPALKEALTFIGEYQGDLIDPSSLVSTDHEVVRALGAGTRTFGFLTDYNVKTLNDPESSTIAGRAKMALVPGNGEVKSGSVGVVRFYGITADSGNKDAAYELIKFLAHRDKNGEFYVAKRWALEFGLGFVQIPLYEDEQVSAELSSWGDPAVIRMQDEYVRGRPYRYTPWFQEWQTESWGEIQKAIIGEESIDDVLSKLAESARSLKASY